MTTHDVEPELGESVNEVPDADTCSDEEFIRRVKVRANYRRQGAEAEARLAVLSRNRETAKDTVDLLLEPYLKDGNKEALKGIEAEIESLNHVDDIATLAELADYGMEPHGNPANQAFYFARVMRQIHKISGDAIESIYDSHE